MGLIQSLDQLNAMAQASRRTTLQGPCRLQASTPAWQPSREHPAGPVFLAAAGSLHPSPPEARARQGRARREPLSRQPHPITRCPWMQSRCRPRSIRSAASSTARTAMSPAGQAPSPAPTCGAMGPTPGSGALGAIAYRDAQCDQGWYWGPAQWAGSGVHTMSMPSGH